MIVKRSRWLREEQTKIINMQISQIGESVKYPRWQGSSYLGAGGKIQRLQIGKSIEDSRWQVGVEPISVKTQILQVNQIVEYPRRQSSQRVVAKIQTLQVDQSIKIACLQGSQTLFIGATKSDAPLSSDGQRSDAAELGKIGNLVVSCDAVVSRDSPSQFVEDFVGHCYCSSVENGAGAVDGALRRRRGLRR